MNVNFPHKRENLTWFSEIVSSFFKPSGQSKPYAKQIDFWGGIVCSPDVDVLQFAYAFIS